MKGLNQKEFRRWLKGQPGAIVGEPGAAAGCPIAMYLVHQGGSDVEVTDIEIEIDGRSRPSPRWAKSFINTIDDATDSVTAEQALKILDQVIAKLKTQSGKGAAQRRA